MYLFAFAGIY